MRKWSWILALVILGSGLVQAGTPEEDKKLIETLKKDYPLETCVVSTDKLGEMGAPIDYLYAEKVEGKDQVRLVRFCCKGCVKSFKKEPAKYLKEIDVATAAKKK
jgi:hypothetical protein